jgi:hypothetical protein
LLLLDPYFVVTFLHRDAQRYTFDRLLSEYGLGSLPSFACITTIVSRITHVDHRDFFASPAANQRSTQAKCPTLATCIDLSIQHFGFIVEFWLRSDKSFHTLLQPMPTGVQWQHGTIRHESLLLQPLRQNDGLLCRMIEPRMEIKTKQKK